jgi:hypothetical protein
MILGLQKSSKDSSIIHSFFDDRSSYSTFGFFFAYKFVIVRIRKSRATLLLWNQRGASRLETGFAVEESGCSGGRGRGYQRCLDL